MTNTLIFCLLLVLWRGTKTGADNLEFCAESSQSHQFMEFDTNLSINSPAYPEPYSVSEICNITLRLNFSRPFGLHIEHTGEKCYPPYSLLSDDGNGVFYSYSNCKENANSVNVATDMPNKLTVPSDIVIQLRKGKGDGFNLTITVYPLLLLGPINSTVSLATTSVYIASHQTFPENPYPDSLTYEFTLSLSQKHAIVIEFVTMSLGIAGDCLTADAGGDVIRLLNDSGEVIYECRDTAYVFPSRNPPVLLVNSTNCLTIKFKTDEKSQFDGFLLRVSTGQDFPGIQASTTPTKVPKTSSLIHTTTSLKAIFTSPKESSSTLFSISKQTTTFSTLPSSDKTSFFTSSSTILTSRPTLHPVPASNVSDISTTTISSSPATSSPSSTQTSFFNTSVLITTPISFSNASPDTTMLTHSTRTSSPSLAETSATLGPTSSGATNKKLIAAGAGAGAGGFLLLIVIVVLAGILCSKSRKRKRSEANCENWVNQLTQMSQSRTETETGLYEEAVEENFNQTLENPEGSITTQPADHGSWSRKTQEANRKSALSQPTQISRSRTKPQIRSYEETINENVYHTIEGPESSISTQPASHGTTEKSKPNGLDNPELYTPINLEKKMVMRGNSLYDASSTT